MSYTILPIPPSPGPPRSEFALEKLEGPSDGPCYLKLENWLSSSVPRSILSQITKPSTRADVLSWYVTTSTLASSIGSEVSGQVLSHLLETKGWKPADAYHSLFWIYAVMGVINALLVLLLTRDCELSGAATGETYARLPQSEDDAASPIHHERRSNGIGNHGSGSGRHGIVGGRAGAARKGSWLSWSLSSSTRSVMYKLWFLLAIDSMADGMVPASLTNYYMDIKFHPAKSTLGDVSSVCYLLGAMSSTFAGPLARKIGLINTMVYTHMPSSTAVLLFPLPPPSAYWAAVMLLIIRVGLNNLDQAPRAAFIAAVVRPDERTAVMGVTSTLRTLSAMTGPLITGVLAADNQFWITFVTAGLCRLSYDCGLWALFSNLKPHQYEGGREGIKGHGHSHASSSRRDRDEEESLEMARIEITPPSKYTDKGSEGGADHGGRDGEDEDANDSGDESEVEQAGPVPATVSKASGSAALRLLTTFGRDDNVNGRSPLTPRTPRHTRPPG